MSPVRGRQYGGDKHKPSRRERAPETESAETTRRNREWLRDRDESNAVDFDEFTEHDRVCQDMRF